MLYERAILNAQHTSVAANPGYREWVIIAAYAWATVAYPKTACDAQRRLWHMLSAEDDDAPGTLAAFEEYYARAQALAY